MKAIHNRSVDVSGVCFVVLNISKIQNESNSQQLTQCDHTCQGCAQYFKDTK